MITLSNVKKTYTVKENKIEVLKGVSLRIEKGEFISIMGKSGCGKSTLLNIIGCMDRFDGGTYQVDGEEVSKYNQKEMREFRNKKIGYIFQAFNLIDDMTVYENIELPLGYAKVHKNIRKERIKELLDMVGLSDKISNYPYQLSGGQQQRVAIARAIANRPEIILADEPTGNLDVTSGLEIMEILKELNRQGTTIILVTHDKEVAGYGNKVINMIDGSVK